MCVRQGVFPPHTAPSLKIVPVLQGSADGVSWLDYEWRDMICDVKRPPPFVAPRQPRVDYKLFYEVRISNMVLLKARLRRVVQRFHSDHLVDRPLG